MHCDYGIVTLSPRKQNAPGFITGGLSFWAATSDSPRFDLRSNVRPDSRSARATRNHGLRYRGTTGKIPARRQAIYRAVEHSGGLRWGVVVCDQQVDHSVHECGGLAHEIRLTSMNNDQIGGLLLAVSAMCFGPISIRSRLFTMSEFLERCDGRGARQIFGWLDLGRVCCRSPVVTSAEGWPFLGGLICSQPARLWRVFPSA